MVAGVFLIKSVQQSFPSFMPIYFQKSGFLFVAVFVLFSVLFSYNIAIAQEQTEAPIMEIKDVKIEKSDTEINISGVLFNSSNNIASSDITYLLTLRTIDPLIKPKDSRLMLSPLIVSADEGREFFSLKPNEQKVFSYNLPISPYIPKLNYLIELSFIHSNGRAEADYSEVVRDLGSSKKEGFLAFDQESCVVLNKNGEKFRNNDGPSFLPGESPEINCLVKNIGNEEMEVFPKILWKEMFVYGMPLGGTIAAESSEEKFVFKAGETKLVNISMPKAEKPQAYQSLLSFNDKDGGVRSFNMNFRWIISGKSARIQGVAQVSPFNDFYIKGDTISLSVNYFGSADLFWLDEENISKLDNVAMKVVIKNKNGTVCGEKEEVLDNITDGMEKNKIIDVVLDKKCQGMSYDVSLFSNQQELAGESGVLPKVVGKQDIKSYLYIGALALAATLLGLLFFRKKKNALLGILTPIILLAGIVMFSSVALAVVIKTYPTYSPYGSGQWWTSFYENTQSLWSGEYGNQAYVTGANANFTGYFNNSSSYGQVGIDYFTSTYACKNSSQMISIQISVVADDYFEQSILFDTQGGSSFGYEKRFYYEQGGGISQYKAFDVDASWMSAMQLKNPKIIVYFRQVGYYDSGAYSGNFGAWTGPYFDEWDRENFIISGEDKAFAQSDYIRSELPLTVPIPSPVVNAGPAHSFMINTNHTHSGASATDIDNNLSSYEWSFDSCPGACPSLSGSSGNISGGSASISGPIYAAIVAGNYVLKLTVTDAKGLVGVATVTESASTPPAPTLTFSANPVLINLGSSSTLSWTSANATACTASDGWSGNKALSGDESVWPTVGTNYTLKCTGSGGSISKSVAIAVNQPNVFLRAIPKTVIFPETDALLIWKTFLTKNKCSASSTFNDWTGIKKYIGDEEIKEIWKGNDGPMIDETHKFTLTCEKIAGGGFVTDDVKVIAKYPMIKLTIKRDAFGGNGKVKISSPQLAASERKDIGWLAKIKSYFIDTIVAQSAIEIKLAMDEFNACLLDSPDDYCSIELPLIYVKLTATASEIGYEAVWKSCYGTADGDVCEFKMPKEKLGVEVIVKFQPIILTPPSNLKGSTGDCGGNINLSWDAVSGATSYTLDRNGLEITGITGTSYADSGLGYGLSYDYRVKACGSGDQCSDYSSVVSVISSDACVVPVPPTVTIDCDPLSCKGYKGVVAGVDGALKLSYSAIDNNDDLDVSTCDFKIDGMTKSSLCVGDFWPTVDSGIAIGSHSASMYAADTTGLSLTASQSFTILRDIEADFDCSLSGSDFKSCSTIVAMKNSSVYFRDTSTASEGASLDSWSWSFADGIPSSSSKQNPIAKFNAEGSKSVSLTITDSAGRIKSITKPIQVGPPPKLEPKWKEVIPR